MTVSRAAAIGSTIARLLPVLALFLLMFMTAPVAADPETDATPTPADAADPDAEDSETAAAVNAADEMDDAVKRKQQYALTAGLLAVVGIAIAGLGLIAGIMLWAGRLRRRMRRPLPTADLKDELWFLRAGSIDAVTPPAPAASGSTSPDEPPTNSPPTDKPPTPPRNSEEP